MGGASGEAPRRVRRVGLNFGAPGDRRDDQGVLWLDYPNVGGPSPVVPVEFSPKAFGTFRRHSKQVGEAKLKWVAASGAEGLERVLVSLDPDGKDERSYTVRLHFLEPEDKEPGERRFDVSLQGRVVLEDFDVTASAGGSLRGFVAEVSGVKIRDALKLELTPRVGKTLISGVEIQAEES